MHLKVDLPASVALVVLWFRLAVMLKEFVPMDKSLRVYALI